VTFPQGPILGFELATISAPSGTGPGLGYGRCACSKDTGSPNSFDGVSRLFYRLGAAFGTMTVGIRHVP
jgi:hypothetical protein